MNKMEELYADLAIKYNVPVSTVKDIVQSQFKFTAKKMNELDTLPVRLTYIGTFIMKKSYREKLLLSVE